RQPPRFALFPYTTLFRSRESRPAECHREPVAGELLFCFGGQCDIALNLDTVPIRQGHPLLVLPCANRHRGFPAAIGNGERALGIDRKSTRLNSSHVSISY